MFWGRINSPSKSRMDISANQNAVTITGSTIDPSPVQANKNPSGLLLKLSKKKNCLVGAANPAVVGINFGSLRTESTQRQLR